MSEKLKIWVIVEFGDKGVKPVSFESIHAARLLANSLNGAVDALCLGLKHPDQTSKIMHYGADNVQVLNNPLFESFTLELWLRVLEPLVQDNQPYAVFFSATTHGKELAASLSARFSAGLATDCVEIRTAGERQIIVRRPVYAGKALANLILEGSGPHVLSLRPNIFRGPGPNSSRTGTLELLDFKLPEMNLLLKVLKVVREAANELDITEARVVVSGGLGMQKSENFKLLEDLALMNCPNYITS